MINFTKDTVFNLKPIDEKDIQRDLVGLFINGEKVIGAYKTIRKSITITN